MNELLEGALSYARRGRYVFPLHHAVPTHDGWRCSCGNPACKSPAKHPRVENGHLDATTDEAQIRGWWKRWPRANIGIACGPSGLVVVDKDPRHGGEASFEALRVHLGASMFDTLTHLTGGGGAHYIFHAARELVEKIGSRADALGPEFPGIDIKGGGGYIVAPPSQHISGARYTKELSSPGEPAELPERLTAMLLASQRRKPIAGADNEERIPQGRRHEGLLRLGGRLRRNGMNGAAIADALVAMNARQCDPPLDEREVLDLGHDVGQRYEPFLKSPEGRTDLEQQLASHAKLRLVGNDDGLLQDDRLKLDRLTEVDAGHAFVKRYGDQIRYCAKAGGWFVWDGRRWKLDEDGTVNRLAEECTSLIADSADAIGEAKSSEVLEQRKKLLNFVLGLRKRRGIENVVAVARWQTGVAVGNPDRFDGDQWLLNVANGTIDLRTGELRPHDRSDLITKLVDVPYDPNAQCERWQRFLDEIFGGDQATVDFLQRAFGYSLTGSTREQIFLVLYGTGANGKSTLLSIIGKCLGDYGLTTDSESFVGRKAGSNTNDLARLRGARFVFAVETSEQKSLAENFVKAVTGGDKISARFLYTEFFEFNPVFKLWLGTNHKPTIKGGDEGIWRRVRLVPFNQRFDGDRCDPDIREKLEAELPGILAWAVRGCVEWQKVGLKAPEAVLNATAAYRSEMDTFANFIADCCVIESNASAGAGELYRAYKAWTEANGEKTASQTWFGTQLNDRGLRKKGGRQRRWLGIALRNDDGL